VDEELQPLAPAFIGSQVAPSRVDASVPLLPVSRMWTWRFAVIWLGFWMANLVPVQLLLPNQLAVIDPANKVHDFAVLNAVSGLVALVALPLCGTLSDRSRSRYGRRRAWIAAGAIAFAAGLLATGLQTSWLMLTVCWSFSMIGLSACTAGLTAVVADRVPTTQRGMVSSAIFGPQALSVIVGIGVVAVFELSNLQGYIVLAVALVALSVPFVARYTEVPGTDIRPLSLTEIVGSLRIDLRANPDFAWAFSGRLLVNLANSLGTCYLLYFLTDALHASDPDRDLLGLTAVYLASGLSCTYAGGYLSDRLQRRRVFVFIAAIMQALAGVLLASEPTLSMTYVCAALNGGGFGAYMSVDQALITQLLPEATSRAKDLGIMNIGAIVPPAMAPLLAGLLITSAGAGYRELFGLGAVIAVLGAFSIYKVRSVR
jgi:MFS family permease